MASDHLWVAYTLQKITSVATHYPEFTTDMVWPLVRMPTNEPRIMGSAIRAARDLGVITKTPEFRPSIRASTHKRPLRVWQSLIYEKS
jgi:hypothetical protein